jgi:hypothetical protein
MPNIKSWKGNRLDRYIRSNNDRLAAPLRSHRHSHSHKPDWVQFLDAGVPGFCTTEQANCSKIPAPNTGCINILFVAPSDILQCTPKLSRVFQAERCVFSDRRFLPHTHKYFLTDTQCCRSPSFRSLELTCTYDV